MSVTGVQHLVERAYRESGELQYLRELVVNAMEAGATHIEIGPEWSAVEREGVYRLMVADDGEGMGRDELLKFLNTFGGGGKPIGDAHENFGVGAKTSLLPWNHHGVVVISWTPEYPDGAMVVLRRDAATGEYGAQKFETADGEFDEVIVPGPEWVATRPEWIREHGTVVVCLGNTGRENTFVGKSGDGDIKGISAYLNKRLWTIPSGVEIYVQELRTEKRTEWAGSFAEASGSGERRWNRRQIRGAAHFVASMQSDKGKLDAHHTMVLEDGTELDWYLWKGERPNVHSYAHKNGFIAALYKNELYDTYSHAARYRSFGITQADVRANLTIIARPPMTDGSYGVYPDTARNALKIQGTRRAGEPLPWADWAQEFADNLPDAIRDALAKATPTTSGSIDDPTFKARLTDRFGARWRSLRYVADPAGTDRVNPDETTGPSGNGRGRESTGGGGGNHPGPGGPQSSEPPTVARATSPIGAVVARAAQVRGGLPEYVWTTMADIDPERVIAAAWCPPNRLKPSGVVQLAQDFPAILEVQKFWRAQYADHHGNDVDRIVKEVYGEAMVARIAHSESLATHRSWGTTKVTQELRSPAALTMSVLGLLSEDHIISARLAGTLGRRRS